ncbi:hypothetical protein ENU1_073410 [Entamoeba nuttalli P19]|uniref:Uncharacterized protein n=2 Tax=Entamoeba nuttalli TaxID=412467 RepID=K2GED5_ENTNP|nr:hypothetical protein ENU1_073410 [Entamoeba nuttalli P19]EKE40971.1 hypothetical protein ENU1_073410 [Entamoeba nuttalli P19]|eukprot:XP_008856694.1 hypothetical protein ENU1_073410 [Entamoeba nuttalli P19]
MVFICLSVGKYQKGEAIPAQYQVKTNDVIYKWEPLPYTARPKFGERTQFSLNDLGVTFFYNDMFKMFVYIVLSIENNSLYSRFSFQNGRIITPYIPIHQNGIPIFTNATINFDVVHGNITKATVYPFLRTQEKFKLETFGFVSFLFVFNEKTHEYTYLSQNLILSGSAIFCGILALLLFLKQSHSKK